MSPTCPYKFWDMGLTPVSHLIYGAGSTVGSNGSGSAVGGSVAVGGGGSVGSGAAVGGGGSVGSGGSVGKGGCVGSGVKVAGGGLVGKGVRVGASVGAGIKTVGWMNAVGATPPPPGGRIGLNCSGVGCSGDDEVTVSGKRVTVATVCVGVRLPPMGVLLANGVPAANPVGCEVPHSKNPAQ